MQRAVLSRREQYLSFERNFKKLKKPIYFFRIAKLKEGGDS